MHGSDRLRAVAAMLESVASAVDDGRGDAGEHVDNAIAQLRGIRVELFGTRKLPGSARERLARHLERHVGEWVQGPELAEVAGITAWPRRLRELREDGYPISQHHGAYRLDRLPFD